MECSIINRETVSKGIQDNARRRMDISGLFSQTDEIYIPKDHSTGGYQKIVDYINESFQEEIVMKMNGPSFFPEEANLFTQIEFAMAEHIEDEFPSFTIVEPSEKLINSYLAEEAKKNNNSVEFVEPISYQELTPLQDGAFKRLQESGLISKESHTINGRTYYKIPDFQDGRNEEKKNRLENIIHDQKINWLNIIYGSDQYLVEVGEVEEIPQSVEEPTQSSKASSITKARVLKFLDAIGFRNIQQVNQLTYEGKRLAGSAYVDFANAVMQIVAGKEDYAFPEEAMHILVELIKESRPALYAEMKKNIVNYKIYRDVLHSPAYQIPLYQKEGVPDYDKIKDEAIAKMLVENMIGAIEGSEQSIKRAAEAYSWWQQILLWIREKFGQYKNPFKQALDELNQDDTTFGEWADISSDDIFLSAQSVDDINSNTPDNKGLYDSIKNRPSQLGIQKQGSDYYKDGQKVPETQRTSALTAAFYKKLFGDRNFDEAQEAFYERSRQDGTYIHEVFEETINSWIDPTTGLMKRNPSPTSFPLPDNPVNNKMRKDIQSYVKGFMAAYPKGTRFLTEQIIYDPNATNKDGSKGRYGTVDFMAILPDNTVDIIDWKSMLMQDMEGAKDYKREGIFIQLNEYRRILKDQYGMEKFGKIRAIPVRKHYKTFPSGNRYLSSIEIGSPNAADITQDDKYLRPIISPVESTGSETRDEIITKLHALYQKYIDKGYFQKDRNILNDVQEAIYEIRTSNSVENLSNYFIDLRTKFLQLLSEEKALLDSSKDDLSEALAMITFYEDIIKNVVEPSITLQEDITISKDSRNKLFTSSSELNFLTRRLKKMRESLLDAHAKKAGIFNLLLPEKVVNIVRRFFRSMGSQDIASVRYMYELVKKAYNRIDIAVDDQLKNLKDLKAEFDGWRKTNNKSSKEAIDMMVDFERGRLHSKIDRTFYDSREKVLEGKKPAEILAFVRANYDMTDYTEWYNKTLEENRRIWEASTYDIDKAKNDIIIQSKIRTFEKNYNIITNPITAFGYHNVRIWSRNIKEENWYSARYKELLKPENAALLNMYNFMVKRNKELADTGSIRDYEAYTFIPNVKKTFADILSFDDSNFLEKSKDVVARSYSNWRKSLSVEDYELNYQGARDPFTGEKLNKRFVPFVARLDDEFAIKVETAFELGIITNRQDTAELGTKVAEWRKKSPENDKTFAEKIIEKRGISYDIFSIYGLMTKEIHKEKYLSENDEIIRSLLHIEKAKPNLLQNKFGTIAVDSNSKPIEATEVGKNARILEEHLKAVVNGESIQYDADYVIQFKLRQKWNNSPLGKLVQFNISPETYKPTSISATKFLLWLNTVNQRRVLGLNAASAISNLFGGSFSSTKLFQKYLSKEDLHRSWLKMTSGGFYQSDDMKKRAALVDYFLPLLNNRESFKSSQLSVSEAAKILSQEWLMAPMRKTSETVQLNIFLALMDNTGVVDGRIVNLREKAAKDSNYEGRYAQGISAEQRKEIEKDFTTKLKSYQEQFSLVKHAQFKTIKQGGKDKVILEIPGISRNSPDVEHLREITQTMSKDSLGEADEFDVANYKYSIWWRLFMTFKNWIPRMADVRYGEFRYDQAHHSHEYGRFRMFARSLSAGYTQAVFKLIPIPYLTGKITNAVFSKDVIIQRAREIYEEKKAQAQLLGKYNPETFITQGEFVDRFIQGTEATYAELRTLILMMTLLFTGLAAPDDDDDSSDKAYKALIRKQMNKLIDEVGFFYSPKSGIDIAGGGMPVFSIVRDTWYLGSDITQQFFGFTFEQIGWDEKGIKMQERAKPIKRTFKVFPVLKEVLTYLPAIDQETAKEWGVKVTDRRGF